jgi:hypothetical protein
VIPFIEKTWFLWWIFAALVILRWFYLFSLDSEETFDPSASDEEQAAAIAPLQLHSGIPKGFFV